jgi:sugar phosphate isomerase/epimerase
VNRPISQHGVQGAALNVELSASFGINAALSNPIPPLKLSLSQLTTLRWKLGEELFQLKQTGYDAIGLWRPKLVEYGESRVAEMLQRAKLSVSSLSFAGGFTGGFGFTYKEALEDGHLAIEQARAVGCKNIVVVSGARHGHTVRHSRRMVVDALRDLSGNAAQDQIKLSLLPMHGYFSDRWTFLNSLDHALEILDEIRHPQVCLAFDAYHLFEEPRLLERISEIAKRTGIVQLSDRNRAPASVADRLIPGDGKAPLRGLVQAFQLAGYAGYFDIQVWSSNVWKSNYSHLIEQSHATVKAMSVREVASSLDF